MALTKERKLELSKEYGKSEKDTGNTDVQVAILTERIKLLTEHLKTNTKDHHTRYGLLKLVGQRRSLLDYLSRVDIDRYRALIKKLNIRK
jgi:small subunit ribosomal protein S15